MLLHISRILMEQIWRSLLHKVRLRERIFSIYYCEQSELSSVKTINFFILLCITESASQC